MKKITLFYFVLFCTIVNAQMTTKLDTIQNVDKLIKPLNKTDFKTNILYDRVVPIAHLTDFNNVKNESTLAHFEQALSELYRASKKSKFTSVDNFRKKYTSVTLKNSVDIGIINTTYNQLNYDEKENTKGALKFSKGKLIPINNKPLFLENHLLVISPLKKYGVGKEINYNFKEELLLQETDNKIVTLTASFDTRETHTIINNGKLLQQSIQIRYTESGYKTLLFTAIFKDGSQKITKGKLFITASNTSLNRNPDDGIENGTITATIPFTGYETGDVPIYGQLEYRIFYHGTVGNYERILKKPIVIIDGFDPFDERKIQESDYPNDGVEHPDAIETLMSYKDNAGITRFLIKKLRLLGYDVVIVNHPVYHDSSTNKDIDGGADYIERNAMAHIALYQELNQKVFDNGSSEELIIMGPSMGGQISRYALAYMEEHNLNHNTKLWVSIDSPHLGANIPIAGQANLYFLGYVHGNQEAKDKYDFLLNSPAGKQQLLIQHSYNSTSLPPYFQQYHTNLESNLPTFKGFPQNLRKIAIVNGSLTKSTNSSGQKVLDVRGFTDVFQYSLKSFQNEEWFMKGTGGTNKIFYGKVDKIFSSYSMTSYYTNPLVYGSLDALQGGMADTQGEIMVPIVDELEDNDDIDDVVVRLYVPNHSFVPTVSGLAFKNSNFKWNEPIDPNLICSDMIPFDTFYAPRNNQKHIYFTQTSVSWLLKELAGYHQSPPSNSYIKPTITGDPEVYTGQIVTYSIPRVAKATTYTWDLDFNYSSLNHIPWTLLNGQGTNSITVRVGSPTIGYVSCRPSNSCGNSQLSYLPVRSYNTSGGGGGGDENPCDDNYGKFNILPNPSNGHDLTIIPYPTDPCDEVQLKQKIKNTVEIYDIYGNKKYNKTFNSNEIRIKGLKLKSGVYVVHLTMANGIKNKKKLLIE